MGINYTVQADVIDIKNDTPKTEDVFLVDTNVWYWLTYSRASQCVNAPASYQISSYPRYTQSALTVGAKIFQSYLSLAELTHLIEKAEYEIFAQVNPAIFPNPRRFDKKFRHEYFLERQQAVSEIEAVWAQVTTLADPLPVTINPSTAATALKRLQTEKIDGYDLFILESMRSHKVVQVITDDGDFATVSGIQVFTANNNVIQAARSQGRLVTR